MMSKKKEFDKGGVLNVPVFRKATRPEKVVPTNLQDKLKFYRAQMLEIEEKSKFLNSFMSDLDDLIERTIENYE